MLFRFFSIILQLKKESEVNLIIDIGNTCVKLVCLDGNDVIEEKRIDKSDSYALTKFSLKYPYKKGIYSTVTDLPKDFVDSLYSMPFPVIEFRSGITKIPLENNYETPFTLGTDRLAAAVGASCQNPGKNILIIDIGTCITFDFVSSKGVYEGGNISLGPTMRLKALHKFTSRLPLVERKGDVQGIGTSTETAIRSGVMNGIKFEIEGYINFFLAKYPQLLVYLTGGVHMDLCFSKKIPIFADSFIVPKGLNRILEYNNEFE